jgi:hypothetical protein
VSNNPLSSIWLLKNRKMKFRSVYVSVLMVATLVFPTAKVVSADASTPTTTTTVTQVTTTTVPPLVSETDMALWSKVAWCETHSNWQHQGWLYEGGLGILHSNWAYYGGYRFAPHAWLATPEQQVWVAKRINAGFGVPDQNGECHAW